MNRFARRSRLLAAVVLAIAAVVLDAWAIDAFAATPHTLPLGPVGLAETRSTREVAPGVRHTRIVRGERSGADVFTVDVAFRASRPEAEADARRLTADGYAPELIVVGEGAPDDPAGGPLGFLVRTGAFATEPEANALRAELTAKGYTGTRTIYTGEDGRATSGPWVVNVLEVDRQRFSGRLDSELATRIVPERELLTSIAARTGALGAVTGGYFVIGPADGTPGDLAGVSILDGELVSEAVNGRTSLLLPSQASSPARVAAVSTSLSARGSDGATREIDGRNRKPGLIRGCGGTGGDAPTERPKHDFTCTDAGEVVQFTPAFGAATEPGEGAEAVLDSSGRVIAVRAARGGSIPADGSVLSGTGDGAAWLAAHAPVGARVNVRARLEAGGRPLAGPTDVVNGGPRLLRGGAPAITAFAEGFHWPESPEFFYRFGVRRNPRTLAGVRSDGDLLLVTVDGRQPGVSVGTSFRESAAVLRSLGARDGVNLDGGGSTAMTVGAALVNKPSDATGERPLGDAVVISPR